MPKTPCKLISDADGSEIGVGDQVTTFRGEKGKVAGWTAPTHPGSSGRVSVEFADGHSMEYFPSVINAHIVIL